MTATAALFLLGVFFAASQARADTFWAKDISISNVRAAPTQPGADIAHVELVISNIGSERDALISAEIPSSIAAAASLDALPSSVYRGGTAARRWQPVFIAADDTASLALEGVHLVLYGIQGPLRNGMRFPVRLTFEKAGAVQVIVEVSRPEFDVAAAPSAQPVLFATPDDQRSDLSTDEPVSQPGALFACQDGSQLRLGFSVSETEFSALVSMHGADYRLPWLPQDEMRAEIVWSDGDHSLTWSSGVKLMWMSGSTHLMCGRSGGHKH